MNCCVQQHATSLTTAKLIEHQQEERQHDTIKQQPTKEKSRVRGRGGEVVVDDEVL